MNKAACPIYRGDFKLSELFNGIHKSNVIDECLENACKILFMYHITKDKVLSYQPVGPYGCYVSEIITCEADSRYGVEVRTSELYLLSKKPVTPYVTVCAVYGKGYWYLTGPKIKEFIETNLKGEIPYPQTSAYRFIYRTGEYDQSALIFLLNDCPRYIPKLK